MPGQNKLDLDQVLEPHRGERHLIVLHSYPDPDAIASGYAHAGPWAIV